jgi:xyloglucan-specific exo-beta-1,4-glucanase
MTLTGTVCSFLIERQLFTIYRHDWGVTGIGLDAHDATKVYISVGMYTNSWDGNVGSILRSSDYGTTWSETKLPFKLPGNQPGRGVGERLVVDPANSNIIYFAAPSGNGLYKSTDQGVTFSKVASFTAVGNYAEDPSDTTGYSSDLTGLTSIVFDTASGTTSGATSRIFVGTAYVNASSVYVSNDAGATWSAVASQPIGYFPKRMKFSAAENALYITYNNVAGPYDAGNGNVYRYATNGTWKNITPAWQAANSLTFGYGGLALDAKNPGTLMVASDNLWYPDVQIFRSTDSVSCVLVFDGIRLTT